MRQLISKTEQMSVTFCPCSALALPKPRFCSVRGRFVQDGNGTYWWKKKHISRKQGFLALRDVFFFLLNTWWERTEENFPSLQLCGGRGNWNSDTVQWEICKVFPWIMKVIVFFCTEKKKSTTCTGSFYQSADSAQFFHLMGQQIECNFWSTGQHEQTLMANHHQRQGKRSLQQAKVPYG